MDISGETNMSLGENLDASKGRRNKRDASGEEASKKRKCISSACVPCRKRKSKCDGTTPACSACAAVYNTKCNYDLGSDHRRKGVYKKDIDNLKTRNSTLHTLVQAILNYPEDEVATLVQQIRICESLDAVAESIMAREVGDEETDEPGSPWDSQWALAQPTFESHLSGKVGELRLEDGSTRYIGGTSHLLYLNGTQDDAYYSNNYSGGGSDTYSQTEDPLSTWTTVTSDVELIRHLIDMYFCWHYSFFTTLSKQLFWRELQLGKPLPGSRRKTEYCTPLLVNAMLALGCHFTSFPGAREVRDDSATAGDHFFKEARRLLLEDDLHTVPALSTVQALALMSVREAGCGREAKGWVYSGMSFRMACDLGLNLRMSSNTVDEEEEDARRITFWGCFLFDKCWSNYLGRLPQLPNNMVTAPKFDVFPTEDSEIWSAYTDSGVSQAHSQPSRTRAVALQISQLCEISSDLMTHFYNPIDMDKTKGKQAELKKLSEMHQRLETWRRDLPKELEPKEGGLPPILVMHMFFQLLFIHLFRPFLKYNPKNSPLPAHVSPRKLCTQAAAMISKLLRLYKRSHGLRQICNIVVYISHTACTIHLLNLPDKNAKRDIIHGVKHLEEIAEGWLCARRALNILSILAKKWQVELPEEAVTVLARTEGKFGPWTDEGTPKQTKPLPVAQAPLESMPDPHPHQPYSLTISDNPPKYIIPAASHATTVAANSGARIFSPDNHSLPPNDFPPTYRIHNRRPSAVTNYPTTPNSTQGTDTGGTNGYATTKNSPSQIFGGVEQLLREGQDWWLQDQMQLASGFENWNYSAEDMTSWLASRNGGVVDKGSPAETSPSPRPVPGIVGMLGSASGGPVAGLVEAVAISGHHGNGVNGVNGVNGANGANGANGGVVGGGAGGVIVGGIGGPQGSWTGYDESEWYL